MLSPESGTSQCKWPQLCVASCHCLVVTLQFPVPLCYRCRQPAVRSSSSGCSGCSSTHGAIFPHHLARQLSSPPRLANLQCHLSSSLGSPARLANSARQLAVPSFLITWLASSARQLGSPTCCAIFPHYLARQQSHQKTPIIEKFSDQVPTDNCHRKEKQVKKFAQNVMRVQNGTFFNKSPKRNLSPRNSSRRLR